MSPAEILKLKISEAMQNEPPATGSVPVMPEVPSGTAGMSEDSETNTTTQGPSKSRSKKKSKANRVTNPTPLKDFPLSKAESDRIVRQPRGPDGSNGFAVKR